MQITVLQILKIFMFNLMKEHHKKFNSLNNLKPQTKDNEKQKQDVLTNVGDIYNELYDIYKSKYNKKINGLNASNKKKLDYKKLRLSDNYQYSSEEEQEDEQGKQDEKAIDANKFNELIIKEETGINRELFMKHFKIQRPSDMFKHLYETKDKKKQ